MFKVGDVVQLKSGGPKMTIKGIIGDENQSLSKMEEAALRFRGFREGDIYCDWFLNDKLTSGVFKPEVLNLLAE